MGSGSRVAVAVASSSIDIAAASLSDVINLIAADQPVKAFYAGGFHADFEWFARPGIGSWREMRGRTVAISTFGSLSDFLTRHVMRRHGLAPGHDARLIRAGETGNRFAALKAGRVDATILLPPFTWYSEELGFTRLSSQAAEIASAWPRVVLFAREQFLAENVHTLRRFLRAYAEAMAGFDERGRFPVDVMPIFWEIAIATGDVKEPWPEPRYLDRRFIDTFDQWALQ